MHYSTLFFPLILALSAASEPLEASKSLPEGFAYAQQFRREPTKISPRTDVDPEIVCGKNYNDCGNGWCCSAGRDCAGEVYNVPVCNAPEVNFPLDGTAVATPFKDLEQVVESLSAALAQFTSDPLGTGGASDSEPTSTGTGQVSNSQNTGAAAALGGPNNFGKTAGMIVGVWGVAALAGAGWILI